VKKYIVTAVVTGAMAAAGFGPAATAGAETGAAYATIADLKAQGYSVQINGAQGDLSDCTIGAVHGLTPSNSGGTVYVDTVCRGGC